MTASSGLQGDVTGNMFSGNVAQNGKGASVFRTVSTGSVGGQQGLVDDADVRPAPFAGLGGFTLLALQGLVADPEMSHHP